MFKKFIDNLTSALGITSNKISELIKVSTQYINAEESATKDINKTFAALKSYAETETPSLGEAISSLANTFEIIEKQGMEKVAKLREQYITPLNELLMNLKKLQTEQDEASKASKEFEKVEKNLSKVKSKAPEKLKPNEIDLAEKALTSAKEKAVKEEHDVKGATEEFNKVKLQVMKTVINNLVDIETIYHEKILQSVSAVKVKAQAIKVDEESKVK